MCLYPSIWGIYFNKLIHACIYMYTRTRVYVHIHVCLYKCHVYIHLCNTYLQDTYMHLSFMGSHAETCNVLRKTVCECVLRLVYPEA